MVVHSLKPRWRSSLASLVLASSLAGVMTACSSDTPTVSQVPATISAQAPEPTPEPDAPVPKSVSFYYDGVKTSISLQDAAILFAANTQNTNDATKIVNYVNNVLKAGPITAADVTGLGDPLKPAISDFTGDGVVNINDVAVLFAAVLTGPPPTAAKINSFIANTLKIPGVTVTQPQLDSLFGSATPTPTPSPTSTPTPTPTPSPELVVSPTSLTIPSGSTETLTVSLPKQPSGNVTVTVTSSSSDITVSPSSLNFTPTSFSGTVTVGSTAAPGTKGTVKLSAAGFADKEVSVTVGQSTSFVVTPTSLEVPGFGTGVATFNVKLAAAPPSSSSLVAVSIIPSTGFIVQPQILSFSTSNFNTNQTVTVAATAAPGTTGTIKVFNSTLGQFDVKVKATDPSVGQFFIDPVNGVDAPDRGTFVNPLKTLHYTLEDSASPVIVTANSGINTTVTIIRGGTEQLSTSTGDLETRSLTSGSITVVGRSDFTLDLNQKVLKLNKGHKLTGFNIVSRDTADTSAGSAIQINAGGTPLTDMKINCKGQNTNNDTCVEVPTGVDGVVITLDQVTIQTNGGKATVGIKHSGGTPSNITTLRVLNSTIESDGNSSSAVDLRGIAATSVNSKLVVRSTEVNLTSNNSGGSGSNRPIAIVLYAGDSEVKGSTIRIKAHPSNSSSAVGVYVDPSHPPSPSSTVQNTVFKNDGPTANAIGIDGSSKLSPDPLTSSANNFDNFAPTNKAIN